MLSVKECREILGKNYENCTDEEILKIRDWLMKLVKLNRERIKRILNEEQQNDKNDSDVKGE